MQQKINVLILCLFLSIFFVFPSRADTPALMSAGTQNFPAWSDFEKMQSAALSLGYDSFLCYFSLNSIDGDGSAYLNFSLYDDPENLYFKTDSIYSTTSKFHLYFWDDSTETLIFSKSYSYCKIASGDELYFSDAIYDQSGTLVYASGPSDTYAAVLVDDTDYQDYINGSTGDGDDTTTDTNEDISNSGLLSGIKSAISSLGSALSSKLDDLLEILSYPSNYVQSTLDDLAARFMWVENVVAFANLFSDHFSASASSDDPPVVTVDLSSTTSTHDYGSSAVVLDLSWYAPYKAVGDLILSSFMWLYFLWSLYGRLPDIISGSGIVSTSFISFAKKERR